jgi:hypothetical protein
MNTVIVLHPDLYYLEIILNKVGHVILPDDIKYLFNILHERIFITPYMTEDSEIHAIEKEYGLICVYPNISKENFVKNIIPQWKIFRRKRLPFVYRLSRNGKSSFKSLVGL